MSACAAKPVHHAVSGWCGSTRSWDPRLQRVNSEHRHQQTSVAPPKYLARGTEELTAGPLMLGPSCILQDHATAEVNNGDFDRVGCVRYLGPQSKVLSGSDRFNLTQ